MLLRQALDDVGLRQVRVQTQVVADPAEAARLHFLGSPTLLINGKDPFDDPSRQPALACRVYRTERGLGGLPEVVPLRQALKRAADAERRHG